MVTSPRGFSHTLLAQCWLISYCKQGYACIHCVTNVTVYNKCDVHKIYYVTMLTVYCLFSLCNILIYINVTLLLKNTQINKNPVIECIIEFSIINLREFFYAKL